MIIIQFTSKGKKKFTASQRLQWGRQIKEAFIEHYIKTPGYEISNQFIPPFGEGSLNHEQMDLYLEKMKNIKEETPNLILGVRRDSHLERFSFLNKSIKNLNLKKSKFILDHSNNNDEMPDAYLVGVDTGFLEDIGLITYALKTGIFGLFNNEADRWLKKYMEKDDKELRLQIFRDLHFEALTNGMLVPLMSTPYAAIVNKKWQFKLSEYYANNQLWLIKKIN